MRRNCAFHPVERLCVMNASARKTGELRVQAPRRLASVPVGVVTIGAVLALMTGFVGCSAAPGITTSLPVTSPFAYLFTTVADGDVWLPNSDDGAITRIDGDSGEVRAHIDLHEPGSVDNPQPQSLTTDPAGDVWAPLLMAGAAVRIDPRTNRIVERVPVDFHPYGVAATNTDLWLTDFEAGLVVRIDRSTGREIARIAEVTTPTAVVVAAGSVWVVDHRRGAVVQIDPATDRVVDRVHPLGSLEGIAASEDALWVASTSNRAVYRIDLDTRAFREVKVGAPAYGVAVGDAGIWVTTGPKNGCDTSNSAVVLIDRSSLRERGRTAISCAFAVGAAPGDLVVVGTDETEPTIVTLRWKD